MSLNNSSPLIESCHVASGHYGSGMTMLETVTGDRFWVTEDTNHGE